MTITLVAGSSKDATVGSKATKKAAGGAPIQLATLVIGSASEVGRYLSSVRERCLICWRRLISIARSNLVSSISRSTSIAVASSTSSRSCLPVDPDTSTNAAVKSAADRLRPIISVMRERKVTASITGLIGVVFPVVVLKSGF